LSDRKGIEPVKISPAIPKVLLKTFGIPDLTRSPDTKTESSSDDDGDIHTVSGQADSSEGFNDVDDCRICLPGLCRYLSLMVCRECELIVNCGC